MCFHCISQCWRVARGVNENLKEAYKIDWDMLNDIQQGILKKTTPKFNTEVCRN